MEPEQPELNDSELVASFRKNSRGEQVQIRRRHWRRMPFIDIRVWYPAEDGMRPGLKGLAIHERQVPELIDALERAEAATRGASS